MGLRPEGSQWATSQKRHPTIGTTVFSAGPAFVDSIPIDRFSSSTDGSRNRVCSQCRYRMSVCAGSRCWSEVQRQGADEVRKEARSGLKRIIFRVDQPTHFVVKMKGLKLGEWYSGVSVSMPSFFIKTAYLNFNEVRWNQCMRVNSERRSL